MKEKTEYTKINNRSDFEYLAEYNTVGIIIIDPQSLELLYANPVAQSYAAMNGKDYKGFKCCEYMVGEKERCQGCKIDFAFEHGAASKFRAAQQGTGRSFSSELKVMEWNGKKVVAAFISDVTGISKNRHVLQHSERVLRQAIEDANLLAWEYDFHRETIMNENSVLSEAGYVQNLSHLPETQIADGYVAQESIPEYRKMFQDMRAGTTVVNGEIWMYRNRNIEDKHCIRISYTVDLDHNQKPVSAFGLGLDVTEEKNIERLYQKQIENIMNTYPDALGSLKMNLTHDYVTDQNRLHPFIAVQSEDYTNIEEYLQSMNENMLDDDYEQYEKTFSRDHLMELYKNGEQQVSLIHRFRFLDKTRWINSSARIIANPLTKDIEAYVFASDVSARIVDKQMMQKLIDARYDIIALIYPEEETVDFRYSSSEYKEMPATIISDYQKNCSQSSKLFDEAAEEYIQNTRLETIINQLNLHGTYSFTMIRMIDGKKHYKRYSYNFLTKAHQIIIATVQDATDLMEREEAQMQVIQEALAEAERANAAKTTFLSNMSHDIRTPMNAIINMTKMAFEDADRREELFHDLEKIQVSSDFLLSLINDILDMARIDSGKMVYQPDVYEYNDFLNYIDSVFTPLCRDKDIKFIWHRGDTAFPLYVDILRFNQMFFNLLSNAVKYTDPGGTIVYDIKNNTVEDGKLSCDYVISDTGRGMTEEFQKKMFDAFERETDRTSGQQGTGLGLAIVKSTVDMMGGTIQVESKVGKGTTFTIHLNTPIATKEQVEASRKKSVDVESISLNGKRILVAEDHPINQEIIKRLLERRGMIIDIVENGQRCVDLYTAHETKYYDAILMDVRMPLMDGLEATSKIRSLARKDSSEIPIIAMTANAFVQDKEAAKKVGMTGYLSKPIEAEEIYKQLASLI